MTAGQGPPGLPHHLRPGLRLVFIGYNPGLESARQGRYYAHPGNVFWRQLGESGLTAEGVGPEDDGRLMDEAGIGFTDLCCRPTSRAGELTPAEVVEGAARLHAEILEHQPGIAVFGGKGIYQLFGRQALGLGRRDLASRGYGEQPERIGGTRAWVIPSSSGLASKWHRERLEWLAQIADVLRGDRHEE